METSHSGLAGIYRDEEYRSDVIISHDEPPRSWGKPLGETIQAVDGQSFTVATHGTNSTQTRHLHLQVYSKGNRKLKVHSYK